MSAKTLEGEGLNTEELFTGAFDQLRQLRNRMQSRRGREKAMELVTELFLSVEALSRRVSAVSFQERPVMTEDDEDDEADERIAMSELLPMAMSEAEGDDVENLDDAELREMVRELRKSRLDYFRIFLAYFCKGCRQEKEVTHRVLAVVRRVSPHLLDRFGLSQAEIGRKLGQGRATISIREKRLVEKPLREAGARGILGNGARGAATSAACARAARGNHNRAGGAGRRKSGGEFPGAEEQVFNTNDNGQRKTA